MKRDVEAIRELLLTIIEPLPAGQAPILYRDEPVRQLSPAEVVEHLVLMVEGGLIAGARISKSQGGGFLIDRLTWEGQEFLSTIRQPEVWEAIKRRAGDKVSELPFEVIRHWGTTLTRRMFESQPG